MNYLLDSSFLIDLQNETASGIAGPASMWINHHPKSKLWVSAVSVAEVLEGAEDAAETRIFLGKFRWQGIHYSHAVRVSLIHQRSASRMGENDAWQVAIAMELGARIVGHDPRAFSRLGTNYEDHRAAV